LSVGISIYSLREFALERSLLARAVGKSVFISAVITSDPHLTQSRVVGSRILEVGNSFMARTEVVSIDGKVHRIRIPIRVMTKQANLSKGAQFEAEGRIIKSKERRVAALFIIKAEVQILSPPSRIDRHLNAIRDQFTSLAKSRDSTGAALIPGIVIGDTRLESSELIDNMRRSGLAHLTAVSGANFAIVTAFILWLTRWITRRKVFRGVITFLFVIYFLELVRPSASVLRAAAMALVIIVARMSGSRSISAASLAIAIIGVLILDPFQGFDPGFVLSVLATSALIFLAPVIQKCLERFLISFLAEAISVSAAATLACTPYLIFLAGEVSLGSVFFNVAAAPVVAPITIFGFLSMALCSPLPNLSQIFFTLSEPMANWIVHLSSLHSHIPSISMAPISALFLILLFLYLLRKSRRLGLFLFASLFALFLSARMSFPGTDWVVGQCDVGQGDALLLNLGKSRAILFDAGPSPRLLDRCLKIFKVKELSLVVISHHHADHFQGLLSSSQRYIGQIWTNSADTQITSRSQRIHSVVQGDRFEIDGTTIEILWPKANAKDFQTIAGDGSLENNRSIVALVKRYDFSLLVTGDIEPEAQAEMMRESRLSELSILKVPHHGSKYQDQGFLESLHPKIALISVGTENSYGHPSPATIDLLRRSGSQVFRTDREGAIALSSRKSESRGEYVFSARVQGKEWWRIRWL
jgi:competence protein ComEC